jgi:glucokinase
LPLQAGAFKHDAHPRTREAAISAMDSTPFLVADLGATNARFALSDSDGIHDVRILPVSAHPTLAAAIAGYLDDVAPAVHPAQAAIAIACPVTGDLVSMTNYPWSFSIRELRRTFGLDRLEVINDFTAIALSVPRLGIDDRSQIGGGRPVVEQPIGIIGPGTGLGVSGLVPAAGGRWTALAGEGGHVTMPATTAREAAVIEHLGRRFGHVSAERLLSGMGLSNLYETLAMLDGQSDPRARDPKSVTEGARSGEPVSAEAVRMFSGMLGTIAGNLALTLGARGGVFIAGGIVPKLGALFDAALFRERFEAKGRMREAFLAAIPTYLITNPLPAFLGLRSVLAEA